MVIPLMLLESQDVPQYHGHPLGQQLTLCDTLLSIITRTYHDMRYLMQYVVQDDVLPLNRDNLGFEEHTWDTTLNQFPLEPPLPCELD